MRRATLALSGLAGLMAGNALAAAPAPAIDYAQAPAGPALTDDPVLRELLTSALQRRPELAAVHAQIAAEHERAPQSAALPDPTLSLGIQNDGFRSLQIGKMETSWIYIVASQTLLWPGKRDLRAEVAALDARNADTDLQRALLTVAADVERGYLDLLLVRDQLVVLGRLESLWQQAEAAARARYEAGEGAQSDFLRAQLERNRLQMRRWSLRADQERRLAVLNRLRGRPMDEPIATQRTLADLPDPPLPDPGQAVAGAWASSPELARARLAGQQADRRVDLARRERWPDLTISAGVMPRGSLETMWQAGVAFTIPVWSLRRQAHMVTENQARGQAARSSAEAVAQLLEQRVRERLDALRAALESNHLYRSGLLVQSEATVKSTLVQYQVGRISFASVLEALSGHLADINGFLDSIATAQRLAIAEREVSLEAPGSAGGSMTGQGVPGAGAPSSSSSPSAPAPAAATSPTAGGSSMSRM